MRRTSATEMLCDLMGRSQKMADIPVQGAELQNDHVNVASKSLQTYGCFVLRSAFDPTLLRTIRQNFLAQYQSTPSRAGFLNVGHRRYMCPVVLDDETGAGDPHVFANPYVVGCARKILGRDMHLTSVTCVVSEPGSTLQRIHRDDGVLFGADIGYGLPCHALGISVPLIDISETTGLTAAWPGTHRRETDVSTLKLCHAVGPILQCGDCFGYDYRTLHAGTPNISEALRPILFLVYARQWFVDPANFNAHAIHPLRIRRHLFDSLPESERRMLMRAERL